MDRVLIKPFSKDRFELAQSYYYMCEYGSVLVPKGYKTNGADIPRIFWSIFPPNSPEYLSAVVVHDYLCDKGLKKHADIMLLHAMRDLGVAEWKCRLFYFCCVATHRVKSFFGIQKPYK